MTVRLNEKIRGKTVSGFLKAVFKKEVSALDERRSDLMERIYRLYITEAQEATMQSLPAHCFNRSNSFNATIERDAAGKEQTCTYSLSSGDVDVALSERVENRYYRGGSHTMKKDHPLAAVWPDVVNRAVYGEMNAFMETQKALVKRIDVVRAEAMTVLNSTNNVAKLIEVWPEIEPFLPPEAHVAPVKWLPAVTVKGLNALLKKAA